MLPNFLNFGEKDWNRPIYRVMSCRRFLIMLRSRENGLVQPAMWDDPFENFVLNGIALASDGRKARFGFRNALYAQCWSFHIETDAMWRIYSPADKCGVKLKTTLNDLFMSLYKSIGEFRDVSCFIGKVQYLTKQGIKRALPNVQVIDPTGLGIAQTLLIKRKAFAPEREVRLIYFSESASASDGVFSYPIDPNVSFQEGVLDPRLTDAEVNNWKREFKEAGFNKRMIQSGLYKPPKGIFIKLPY